MPLQPALVPWLATSRLSCSTLRRANASATLCLQLPRLLCPGLAVPYDGPMHLPQPHLLHSFFPLRYLSVPPDGPMPLQLTHLAPTAPPGYRLAVPSDGPMPLQLRDALPSLTIPSELAVPSDGPMPLQLS